jgi:cytoplasmic iron level regulating protein YaaA (DUF328/UPF0246 family)
MFAVLSPAKKMAEPNREVGETTPALSAETARLIRVMRKKNPQDLRALMGISENLANLNFERYQVFEEDPMPLAGSPAALTFAGDTYVGFDAPSLSDDALSFAQEHVGILSGLYGLLRPLDRIQPYRLEMGVSLKTRRGTNLYGFWGDRITNRVNELTENHTDRTLVNLASNEYFSSVNTKKLKGPVITPVFKEMRDGKAKVISFLAKKARGAMARHIVQGRIDSPDALKRFSKDGYGYEADLSTDVNWVFLRTT